MNTEITFTERASSMLSEEKEKFEKELRHGAIEQALMRGEPVEITVSDVEAGLRQITGESAQGTTDSYSSSFRYYVGGGALLLLIGLFYPAIKYSYLSNEPSERLSLTVSFIGFGVMLVGLIGNWYLKFRRDHQLKKFLRGHNKEIAS